MSDVQLADAQAMLAALIKEQIDNPIGNIGSVTVGNRTIQYRSFADIQKQIDFYRDLVRQGTTGSRRSYSVASFNGGRGRYCR